MTGDSTAWGRIDDDGTVYVRTGSGERAIGSWRAGTPDEGLAHFRLRYDDLAAEVSLLEKRLTVTSADPDAIASSARRLADSLPTVAAIGDLDALQARLGVLLAATAVRRKERSAERAARAAAATAAKGVLADEAAALARSSEWKSTGDRFRTLAEEFKAITGADRKADAEMWKRIAAAREEFTRRRGAHFAALDTQRAVSAGRKEALVAEAEALSASTDWVAATARYKAMMADWKGAGRAQRDVDDALWARFRAAQDAFFAARTALTAERDAAERVNQAEKEKLLAEAEAIDTAKTDDAKRRLRAIQDRWDAVGRVPRDAAGGLEKRLTAVGDRIRDASDARWTQPDPEASPLVTRLRESVAKLERKIEKAGAAGRKDEASEAALATQREWLAQATRR